MSLILSDWKMYKLENKDFSYGRILTSASGRVFFSRRIKGCDFVRLIEMEDSKLKVYFVDKEYNTHWLKIHNVHITKYTRFQLQELKSIVDSFINKVDKLQVFS